jgi:hypothetical protein
VSFVSREVCNIASRPLFSLNQLVTRQTNFVHTKGLLNIPHKLDNLENPNRTVTPTTDYGMAALLNRIAAIQTSGTPFANPNVGIGITEHNTTTAAYAHTYISGLWSLAVTQYYHLNPRGVMTTSFVFDSVGDQQGGYGHHYADGTPDYKNQYQ